MDRRERDVDVDERESSARRLPTSLVASIASVMYSKRRGAESDDEGEMMGEEFNELECPLVVARRRARERTEYA